LVCCFQDDFKLFLSSFFRGGFGGGVGIDLNENNGKASILCETARLLKDLLSQIESLKKENVTLLSESHYVRLTPFSFLFKLSFSQFLVSGWISHYRVHWADDHGEK